MESENRTLVNKTAQNKHSIIITPSNEESQQGAQFQESEAATATVHKMSATLFSWIKKMSQGDSKYTDKCMMENFHYFYALYNTYFNLFFFCFYFLIF